MADALTHVSIYTEGKHVWLTIHDGHREELHARLTPEKARDIAETLTAAAHFATIGAEVH